jgi:folylpolyglutamate synthase/dihydropteroate synthase
VVVAPQPPDALAVFEARAAELEAPLSRYGQEWTVARQQNDLVFTDRLGERKLPLPALPGAHQIPNAGAALACLPFLEGFCIDGHAQMRGLSEVQWPARLQRLTRGPLARSLPPGCELWLDGGHNESAGAALAETPRLGKPISQADLAEWDINILPDGTNLPPGSDRFWKRRRRCAGCGSSPSMTPIAWSPCSKGT